LTISWIALLATNVATLGFGVVVVFVHGAEEQYLRSVAAAAIGMGLFGAAIARTGFRRRERWAYAALCYCPVFWAAHLVFNLPPGQDHLHQVLFIALSLLGLLLPVDLFFGPGRRQAAR
jgi:hypothetical protein